MEKLEVPNWFFKMEYLWMTKRKLLSIMFYHIGHNVDRLLWMISPTYEWLGDKLADLYQWAMRKSIEYDDHYEVWK